MPERRVARTRRAATVIGVGSGAIGAALLVAPARFGPLLGLTRLADVRAVGLIDLALAPGLILGRSRSPWATSRAASNVLIAGWCLNRARSTGLSREAGRAAAALVVVTVLDARLARDLRRDEVTTKVVAWLSS